MSKREGAYSGDAISKDVTINLANLLTIDDKLNSLADCLKKNNISQISQLCSDWWELTDEEDYAVAQFSKAFNDTGAKRDLKHLMVLEILSIAIVNYFTSSPEIFRPSNIQINQVRNLLSYMHQNLSSAIELILSKLPASELSSNPAAAKLQQLLN